MYLIRYVVLSLNFNQQIKRYGKPNAQKVNLNLKYRQTETFLSEKVSYPR
jgi:hypothetical protein